MIQANFQKSTSHPNPSNNVENVDESKVIILVVDDVFENRQIVMYMLKSLGVQNIETAAGGREALQKVGQNPGMFDLVFLDLQMPDLDGYETVRALRNSGFAQHVYALTGNSSYDCEEPCLEAGFNGVIEKPVTTQKLAGVVSQILRFKSSANDKTAINGAVGPDSSPSNSSKDAIYRTFLARVSLQVEDLVLCFSREDWQPAERIIHQMKGAAGACGFLDIMALCERLEDELSNNRNKDRLERLLAELVILHDQALSTL